MRLFIFSYAIVLFTSFDLSGQRLVSFTYEPCDRENPHIYNMNTMVNHVYFTKDSSLIKITWINNCSFKPDFSLKKVNDDTIYLDYHNKAENESNCRCAFALGLHLKGLQKSSYNIKVNEWVIDKSAKRYNTEGYIIEYYPEYVEDKKKLREIYHENGKLFVEVFYDKEGRITSEKHYRENWGFLQYECKY